MPRASQIFFPGKRKPCLFITNDNLEALKNFFCNNYVFNRQERQNRGKHFLSSSPKFNPEHRKLLPEYYYERS